MGLILSARNPLNCYKRLFRDDADHERFLEREA